jgi:NNP family nitrate/nitrite transporter-like MFS transporter
LRSGRPAGQPAGGRAGYLVNIALPQSFLTNGNGNGNPAYIGFILFYVICRVLTWLVYLRPSTQYLKGI